MEHCLNDAEVRILGCLVEKELATPEYYPLTLNSLTAACNQKSNRDPVVAFDEATVVKALDSLRFKGFARQSAEGVRAPKYCHSLMEKLCLEPVELALLTELLLRGPQTVGELRTRCGRMYPMPELPEVEALLQTLQEREEPLVTRLPRQPGRKEARYAHLFAGIPDLESLSPSPEPARLQVQAENERIDALEQKVELLTDEIGELRRMMLEFRSQFE